MNKQDLLDQQELIQNDIMCVLDGLRGLIREDDCYAIETRICDIVIHRMHILLDRYDARFHDDLK